jgi:hypothetical protein
MPIIEQADNFKYPKCDMCAKPIIYGAKFYSNKKIKNTLCLKCYNELPVAISQTTIKF